MTKTTAAEAIDWLTSDKAFGQECYSRKQIAALIEQQAAEIEKLQQALEYERVNHQEAVTEIERLGQGGSSFTDSQWLDKLARTEQRAEQAEAQNKRMQTATNRYVIGNIDLLDALKAALEGKA